MTTPQLGRNSRQRNYALPIKYQYVNIIHKEKAISALR